MQKLPIRPSKIPTTITISSIFLPKNTHLQTPLFFFSTSAHHQIQQQQQQQQQQQPKQIQDPPISNPPIVSPSRVHKLIASQTDPILAKQIFDYASRKPNFQHSYSTYLLLILKLGRSKHLSLIDNLFNELVTKNYPLTPKLFSHLIKIYRETNQPDKAIEIFRKMIELNLKAFPKHLERILEILVSRPRYLKPAFELFKEAHEHGIVANTKSYNLLMRGFCLNGRLSVAYKLFEEMSKREVLRDIESYRIIIQGLCRRSQVNAAVGFLEDMFNKGYVPDSLVYTTILNSLCRKKKLREAYKLLCKMKLKGCNPDIVHYNTVILGFCREGRAADACKIIGDMESNGCSPNLVSYRTLVGGLCEQGILDEGKRYLEMMLSKGFSPHFSVSHGLARGFCDVGKVDEACGVVEEMLKHGETVCKHTWVIVIPRICEPDEMERIREVLNKAIIVELKGDTKVVDAGVHWRNT